MNSWPSASDISGFLADLGVDPIPSLNLGELVDRSVEELHSMIGYSPFLAGSESSFEASARQGEVSFGRPMATVVSVTHEASAETFSACPELMVPIRKIVLDSGLTGAVTVTGRIGYGVAIPMDVWYAVRDMATAYALDTVGAVDSTVESVKQDSVTVKYGAGRGAGALSALFADRARVVFSRYVWRGIAG
jgi:hypothetical protein